LLKAIGDELAYAQEINIPEQIRYYKRKYFVAPEQLL
jgi:hypothetical protein